MKMEKSAREILVTLTHADQEAFGVHYGTMSFTDPKTRRFCEYMAVLVCLREGISETGNVTVRAAESASGELLLYFSCPRETGRGIFSAIVEFESADSLLDCRRVFSVDASLCAEVYRHDKKYYLWYEYDTSPAVFDAFTLSLLEYGSVSSVDRSFLTEHAIPLPAAVSFFLN